MPRKLLTPILLRSIQRTFLKAADIARIRDRPRSLENCYLPSLGASEATLMISERNYSSARRLSDLISTIAAMPEVKGNSLASIAIPDATSAIITGKTRLNVWPGAD